MRTNFDLTPFRRATVGFDRLFDMLENGITNQTADNYPPFDLEQQGNDRYRITLAVAGFRPGDVSKNTASPASTSVAARQNRTAPSLSRSKSMRLVKVRAATLLSYRLRACPLPAETRRGTKRLGLPVRPVASEFIQFRRRRDRPLLPSPQGSIHATGSASTDIASQNARSLPPRSPGALPTIIAPLIAPIDAPDTERMSKPAASSTSNAPT